MSARRTSSSRGAAVLAFAHAPVGPDPAAHAPRAPVPLQRGLVISGLSFSYGAAPVLEGIDLSIPEGELVSLLGPSGSGKSTLLRLAAGLERPAAGHVAWNGARVEGPSLARGVVFQDYSLFPWMSMLENVSLALARSRPELRRRERRDTAEDYLRLVGLEGAIHLHPHQLSGGMQQRGAIARAFALQSPLLLMDEPFGALDPVNRARLQDLLLSTGARAQPRKTVVLVTHDVEEAIFLGTRVVVLGASPGRIIADLPVSLPRPRHRREVFASREFARLEERIAELYRHDTMARIDEPGTLGGLAEGI